MLVLITGALTILRSFFVDKWWGPKLVRFGTYRILTMVIGLVIIAAVILPVMGNRINQMADLPANFNFNIPVQGEEVINFQQNGMELAVGIHCHFTTIFFLACVIAVMGIISRIYLNKMLEKSSDRPQESED